MATEYTRLPQWVRPINYSLFLFDLVEKEPWTYQGRVEIELALQRQVNHITLHARYIKVHAAQVFLQCENGRETVSAIDITYDAHYQRCTLLFEKELPTTVEQSLTLSIHFEGTIGDDLVGFYRSIYESEPVQAGTERSECYMYSTQFQPCEARRAFPCFDEPDLKATFDFSIETSIDMIALSNMPVKEIRPSSSYTDRTVTVFERTPIMSTYLLAWAVGHFEHLEANIIQQSGKSLPIRLYTTPGLASRGNFALQLAQRIVPYFVEKFGIEYPLPKLDLLAVHDMADSMENWGLLTFEMGALLFDPESSDASCQYEVAYTVAHEIAHQWFGNLVTMQFWDDLWLNEAFATWAGILATDHFFPQWNVWAKFVGENMQDAFELDALHSSHPIHVPVLDDLEVDSIFDSISYDKGCSVVRMIADLLGVDTFLRGVSYYLTKHSYSNTKAEDLWSALNHVSGEDVLPFVTPWVEQMGFPIVTVEKNHSQGFDRVHQQPFSYTAAQTVDIHRTPWRIPLHLTGGEKQQSTSKLLLKSQELSLQDGSALRDLPNANYAGFYRTNLSASHLDSLSSNFSRFSVAERTGLIRDVFALAFAEGSDVDSTMLLKFLKNLEREDNYYVCNAILSSMAFMRSMFSHNAVIAAGLDAFLITLVSPVAKRSGWPDSQSTADARINYLPEQTRSELFLALGMAGDADKVNQLRTAFRQFSGDDRSGIPVSLEPAIFQVSIHQMGHEAFKTLKTEYLHTTSVDGKEKILKAIGQGLKPDLFTTFIEFVFSKQVGIQNIIAATGALADNPDIRVRELLWTFIQQNWEMVFSRLGGSNVIFERFVRGSLQTLTSSETCAAIVEFFKNKDTTGYSRGLSIVVEKVQANASYIGRDSEVLEELFRP